MSKQVTVNGELANSLGLSPIFWNKVVVQLQPWCKQTWGSGMRRLEMGLCKPKKCPQWPVWLYAAGTQYLLVTSISTCFTGFYYFSESTNSWHRSNWLQGLRLWLGLHPKGAGIWRAQVEGVVPWSFWASVCCTQCLRKPKTFMFLQNRLRSLYSKLLHWTRWIILLIKYCVAFALLSQNICL